MRAMEMPDGSTYTVTNAADDRERDPIEMEIALPPGAFTPPPHVHPRQLEEYEVVEGELDVRIGGEWRKLRPGGRAAVPAGVVHTFRIGSSGARFRSVHRPALEFEEMVRALYELGRAGRITSARSPKTPIYVAMAWRRYARTVVAAGAFRPAMAILAGIGRVLGYRLEADAEGPQHHAA